MTPQPWEITGAIERTQFGRPTSHDASVLLWALENTTSGLKDEMRNCAARLAGKGDFISKQTAADCLLGAIDESEDYVL